MKRLSILTLLIIAIISFTASIVDAEITGSDLYKVGIGDDLNIVVIGHKDLSTPARVAIDGTIAFPHIGNIYVKDKSLREIKEEITSRLGDGYVKYPVVSVFLMAAMSKRIYIHGEVMRRGMIPFEKDMTIIQALSVAGGISDDGLYGKIKLRRKQKDAGYKIAVESILHKGIVTDSKIEDMLLRPDDILIVERSDTFFIQGEVKTTGQFKLETDMTVSRAITIAGGIREDGLYGKLKIRRKREGSTGYVEVKETILDDGIITDKDMEEMLLEPDDILYVERNETFFIQGEVGRAGQYILESDMTVSRAITIAGGIGENGLHGKVKVRRKSEDGSGYVDIKESDLDDGDMIDGEIDDVLLKPDDILKVERNKNFIIEGEVAAPNQYLLEYNMTVGRAITVSGGITEGGTYGKVKVRRKKEGQLGYDDIEVDLEGIIEGSETGDMILQPDDILIVERSKTYIVYGEVNRIGEFPLANDTTVFKAILAAGGFNKWGKESKVKVLRLKGDSRAFETIKVDINDILDGDAKADIYLQPGDVVVVSSGIF